MSTNGGAEPLVNQIEPESSEVDLKEPSRSMRNAEALNNSASDGSVAGFHTLEDLLQAYVPPEKLKEVFRILHGYNEGAPVETLPLPDEVVGAARSGNFDLRAYRFSAAWEQLRAPRVVRLGLVQNAIVVSTASPYKEQREAIVQRVEEIILAAAKAGVNVLCLQEAWTMPFAFCTRERSWSEFAEVIPTGESVLKVRQLAKEHGMVIVAPMLERDPLHQGTIWNTAVVVGTNGHVIGKHRKNHIPRVGDFNESTYYMEGNTGHPVFETPFGKIGINICYGRHHPMNWQAFAMNGAEIVFNPSATVGELSEPMWAIEARNAAIANSYFVGAINRVGTEVFPNAFTSGDGKPAHKDFGHFYGSSYFAAPDASRTPSLSRCRDGLLIADVDLNLCQQVKDKWGFAMTGRHEMYSNLFSQYVRPDFTPQIIRDPALG